MTETKPERKARRKQAQSAYNERKYWERIVHLVNSTISETLDMKSPLYSFHYLLELRVKSDDFVVRPEHQAPLLSKRNQALFHAAYTQHGIVILTTIKRLFDEYNGVRHGPPPEELADPWRGMWRD